MTTSALEIELAVSSALSLRTMLALLVDGFLRYTCRHQSTTGKSPVQLPVSQCRIQSPINIVSVDDSPGELDALVQ